MRAGSILDGKYELVRRIADGSVGTVWEGRNVRTEREIAVKVMITTGRDEDRQRMLREARACGRTRHVNVIDVYDVGETDGGNPFIVMELLRGETLAQRLERGPLPLATSLAVLRDVGRGLSAAHKAGVVHRDLKPQNIYLHRDPDSNAPVVKLVDFAISRIDAEATLTVKGTPMGSPGYMAPEQARAGSVDRRADIWAFGVIAYELFTGLPPFDGSTVGSILKKVTAGPLPELPSIAPRIDVDLRAIVGGCLVRDPNLRFQNVVDAVIVVERALARLQDPAGEPASARASESDDDAPTTIASAETTAARLATATRGRAPLASETDLQMTSVYRHVDPLKAAESANEISIVDASTLDGRRELHPADAAAPETLRMGADLDEDTSLDEPPAPTIPREPPTVRRDPTPAPAAAPAAPRASLVSLTDEAPTRLADNPLPTPLELPFSDVPDGSKSLEPQSKEAGAPADDAKDLEPAPPSRRSNGPLVVIFLAAIAALGLGFIASRRFMTSDGDRAPAKQPVASASAADTNAAPSSTDASAIAPTATPSASAAAETPTADASASAAPSASAAASASAAPSAPAEASGKPPVPPPPRWNPPPPRPPPPPGVGPYTPPSL